MKTVLKLGALEKKGLIKIVHVNYMDNDEKDVEIGPTIGYLIAVLPVNIKKIPENLKYNWEGTSQKGEELFGVFI